MLFIILCTGTTGYQILDISLPGVIVLSLSVDNSSAVDPKLPLRLVSSRPIPHPPSHPTPPIHKYRQRTIENGKRKTEYGKRNTEHAIRHPAWTIDHTPYGRLFSHLSLLQQSTSIATWWEQQYRVRPEQLHLCRVHCGASLFMDSEPVGSWHWDGALDTSCCERLALKRA